MSVSLIVVALGVIAAAVCTGVLAARCAQAPRLFAGIWALALFGLAVGLGAQTLGYLAGYSGIVFRAMELGVQVIAPLGLILALAEVLGRSVGARFATRLLVAAVAVVALVILGTDPLNLTASFGATWPNPAVFYQPVPLLLIEFALAPLTAVAAVASVLVAAVRARRGGPDRDLAWPAVLGSLAALALALPGLSLLAHTYAGFSSPVPASDLFAMTGTIAAILAGYAGVATARLRVPGQRDADLADADGGARRGAPGGYGAMSYQSPAQHTAGHSPRYRPEDPRPATGYLAPGGAVRYPGLAALLAADSGADQADDDYRERHLYDDHEPGLDSHDGYLPAGRRPRPARYLRDDAGFGPHTGDQEPAVDRHEDPAEPDPHARLFGQIVIYSLLEEHAADFDRLTEGLVARVREDEPDTLVYIVHRVPNAPLQRILYEVYRDRPAFEGHLRQSYVVRYDEERQHFVAAMNVIELGLQQAKVSPFPSISEILTESGIDLTGVTRQGRRSASGPGAGRPDAPLPGGRARAPGGHSAAETFGDQAGERGRPGGHPYEPDRGAARRRDSRYP